MANLPAVNQRLTMSQGHRVRVHNILSVLAWGAAEVDKAVEERKRRQEDALRATSRDMGNAFEDVKREASRG